MPVTNSAKEIINNALRLLGSYHIPDDDTSSATYEITQRAFEEAANSIFSENIFQFNTKRIYAGPGTAVSTLSDGGSPSTDWSYRHTLPDDYNLLIRVVDKSGTTILDWTLDNSTSDADADVPYLFTTEEYINIYYTFVPDLITGSGTNQGDQAIRMPAYLARLMSLHIAANSAIELSGSETRADYLYQTYEKALRRARVIEGRSSPAQQYINDSNSSFVNAIKYYGKV
jgi:predicted GNAT family acetyltransferase